MRANAAAAVIGRDESAAVARDFFMACDGSEPVVIEPTAPDCGPRLVWAQSQG
jgi:hypothetical protein